MAAGAILLLLAGCAVRRAPEPPVGPGAILEVTFPEPARAAPPEAVPVPAEPAPPVRPEDPDALPDCAATADAPLLAAGVAGALPRDAVLSAVLGDLAAVRACVQDALPLSPRRPGQVVVRLSVTPEGRVARSTVAADTTEGDGRLAECLAAALARTAFPAADGPTWICWPVNVRVR